MVKLSANLGFLWNDLPLPAAIEAAATAGFDAVECHVPYRTPTADVSAALQAAGVPMVSINTSPGDPAAGDRGLAALPERVGQARSVIDEAIAYAAEIECRRVHVMAGIAPPDDAEARHTFIENLSYGAERAAEVSVGLVIEPINPIDMPGYHLNNLDDAADVVAAIAATNVGIMFDCYHIARIHGDVAARFHEHAAAIHHVQFAGVPDRREPDTGEVDYATLLPLLVEAGYSGHFGAEYRPSGRTDASLGWMQAVRHPG